jgi:3-hydroxybutyryl-CoA dehydrogenase
MPQNSGDALTVAIIGAGPLGRWLALRAARSGVRVYLEDVLPSTLHHAREYIRQQLSAQQLSVGALEGEPSGVHFVSTIEDAVREADLVIDCVPDELESKLEILWLLDRMAPPQAVFATPTTTLSIDDLASCTYRPEKCIAIAAAPAVLAELESHELIPLRASSATAEETKNLVIEFWRRAGFRTSITPSS